MNRILLADDNTELCEMLQEYLEAEGFQVEAVHNGEEALERARSNAHDLLVLDVMMPKRNGCDVLRDLRVSSLIPVLMLTAPEEGAVSIVGLELGADDYVPKPWNPRVLVARIRAALRRTRASAGNDPAQTQPDVLTLDDLQIHTGSRSVVVGDKPIAMTSIEYSVLEVLLREAGHVVSKADLSECALGRKLTRYDRSIDMQLSSLRNKLGPLPNGTERIKTVRSVGYQYTSP